MGECRRVSGAMVEAGDHARERPGKLGRIVGDDRQIEGLEARRVAVGAERERGALRTKPLDRMSQHRPARSMMSPLSAAPMRRASPPSRMRPRIRPCRSWPPSGATSAPGGQVVAQGASPHVLT